MLVSVFFPPLPVWIRRGFCSCDSLINILLCLLGYLPGLIHSWYIIAKYPPYVTRSESKIYYIYRDLGDLEAGRGRHRQARATQEPNHIQPILSIESGPSTSYGAIAEHSPAGIPSAATNAPPAYSELDNKVQK